MRDFLLSAVGAYNCRGGTNGENPTEITKRDLSAVGSSLATSNAFKFVNGKEGADKYGSSPIRSGYMLFANTLLQPYFDSMDGFKSSWEYPNMDGVAPVEYGSVLNFRIYTSSESASEGAVGEVLGYTVFDNMAVARESYAHIDQDGYSSQLIYRPPIFSGPLALNGTLGAKYAQAMALTQSTWIRNVRCSVSNT